MRLSGKIASICFVFGIVGSAHAQSGVLAVNGSMDIFRAGGYNDGSNGSAPAQFVFRARPNKVLLFSSVTGEWQCLIGGVIFGPDGTNQCPQVNFNGPVGPFSGYYETDFQGALVGMFLEDFLPPFPPPPLRFYVRDYSQGGIPASSRLFLPRIGQVFFIGDGRTGTGGGHAQVFAIPPTATHLYLGYADQCSEFGSPNCYADNAGTMTAVFHILNN